MRLCQLQYELGEASHHRGYLGYIEVTQWNLGLPLPPNSPDLHKNNKTKFYTEPASLFPRVTLGTKTINPSNNAGDISLP